MKSILKQLFSLILPVTVLVVIPASIEASRTVEIDALSVFGLAVMAAAGMLFVWIVVFFVRSGKGTLAPWSPAQKLICGGVYAHTRNPMLTCVLTLLLSEAMVLHSTPILIWCVSFFAINNIYFVLVEEPGLEKRFGEEYSEYKRNVPR